MSHIILFGRLEIQMETAKTAYHIVDSICHSTRAIGARQQHMIVGNDEHLSQHVLDNFRSLVLVRASMQTTMRKDEDC